jgi:GGDEF domain-containing protein
VIDPLCGLLTSDVFWRDFGKAVHDAEQLGNGLSVARFSFEGHLEPRVGIDAARLVGRLMRNVDFACREMDGSIIAVFTETDLRSAHVIARRIASVLKHTTLCPGSARLGVDPTVTLATWKTSDTLDTLMARVDAARAVAAG